MATLVNLKRFLKRPKYLDGMCYVPQCSKYFLEKSIKYQLKKWVSNKVFIFYFRKVLKLNFAQKFLNRWWRSLWHIRVSRASLKKTTCGIVGAHQGWLEGLYGRKRYQRYESHLLVFCFAFLFFLWNLF
jgi:hypothetical protein